MAEGAIIVEGLDEITRSLNASPKLYAKAAKKGLLQGAEPIRKKADGLSMSEISGMKRGNPKSRPRWSVQRLGETVHEVYIAPTQKGIKGRGDDPRRRPNFAVIMMGKSYEPALEQNREQLRVYVDNWLGTVTRGEFA